MSTNLVINGTTYAFPVTGDKNWGTVATAWATAVSSSLLQKSGGNFTLTAEVNFGATYGLKTAYYKSQTSNPASAGALRLAKTDSMGWRNNANGADLLLSVDSSDRLLFNGAIIASGVALTASRAMVTDSAGDPTVSATTATEITYVNGVTSALLGKDQSGTYTNKVLSDSTCYFGNVSDTTKRVKFSLGGATTAKTLTLLSSHTDNQTVTIPDYTDTVALLSLAQNLSNKGLNSSSSYFYLGSDASIRVFFDSTGSTTSTKSTLTFLQTANRVITFPDATDTVILASQVQNLSNKGINNSSSYFYLGSDSSVRVYFANSGATTSTKTTMTFTQTADRVVTFQDASGTVCYTAAPTFSTSATFSYATVSTVPYFDASKNLVSSSVTPTELGYVSGVTSAIQTQMNLKAPLASPTFSGTQTFSSGSITSSAWNAGTSSFTNSGGVSFNGTTDATSTTTGIVQIAGGASVVKAFWVGGLANIAGVTTLANTTDASSSTVGGTVISGGLAIAKKLYVGTTSNLAGTVTLPSGSVSSSAWDFGASTFGGSGVATFTGQLIGKGTATNDSAASGYIGEFQETVTAINTAWPSATGVNGSLASVTLSAGDWVLDAHFTVKLNGATLLAAIEAGICTSAAGAGGLYASNIACINAPPSSAENSSGAVAGYRVKVASGTPTYYLSAYATFTAGNPTFGARLTAIRIR